MPSLVPMLLLLVVLCILFVTWPHKTTPLRCHEYMNIYGWELLAACHHPEKLVILIVRKGKMLYQKHESYKYVLTLKNWVDWITARWEKTLQPQKCTFWKKCQKLKKRTIFLCMTTFYNFALKIETSWAKSFLSPFWKLETPQIILLCMFGLCIIW